jgi:AhpD family alkylhydroperoxidase
MSAADADRLVPGLERALTALDGAVWLEPVLRELVEVRTAQVNGSPASLARHAREAIGLGESHARLAAVSAWRGSDLFTARERAALALADAVALLPGSRPLAGAWREAGRHFGEDERARLVFACIVANAWDRLEVVDGTLEAA